MTGVTQRDRVAGVTLPLGGDPDRDRVVDLPGAFHAAVRTPPVAGQPGRRKRLPAVPVALFLAPILVGGTAAGAISQAGTAGDRTRSQRSAHPPTSTTPSGGVGHPPVEAATVSAAHPRSTSEGTALPTGARHRLPHAETRNRPRMSTVRGRSTQHDSMSTFAYCHVTFCQDVPVDVLRPGWVGALRVPRSASTRSANRYSLASPRMPTHSR